MASLTSDAQRALTPFATIFVVKVNSHLEIWTVGHSTRADAEFLNLIRSSAIEVLIDVRSFPGSRRYPHFNQKRLQQSLKDAGIDYRHMPELGGRRKARPDSRNLGWRNESFRGYADYMETTAFAEAIEQLIKIANEKPAAIMCAEAVWWRCHRSLIADYLKVRGITVRHIIGEGKVEVHPFTPAAQIINGELSYRGVLESSN